MLPVMSPSSLDAWKIVGFSNVNIAWPDVPVRERRRDTSGTVASFTPGINCSEAASQICKCCLGACRRGAARAAPWKGRTPGQSNSNTIQPQKHGEDSMLRVQLHTVDVEGPSGVKLDCMAGQKAPGTRVHPDGSSGSCQTIRVMINVPRRPCSTQEQCKHSKKLTCSEPRVA